MGIAACVTHLYVRKRRHQGKEAIGKVYKKIVHCSLFSVHWYSTVQECDPEMNLVPKAFGCHPSLKCCHERRTLNRAWQVKLKNVSGAGLIHWLFIQIF